VSLDFDDNPGSEKGEKSAKTYPLLTGRGQILIKEHSQRKASVKKFQSKETRPEKLSMQHLWVCL
jgi:hypothetical protein